MKFMTSTRKFTISCILPDHNEIRLEIKSKGNNRNCANSWLWSSTLLNDERFKFTKLIKSNENENQHTRAFGMLCKEPEKRKSSIYMLILKDWSDSK